ncbi:MAG: hypothetical protein ACRED9_04670 [Caulobacteraceae bacterium]
MFKSSSLVPIIALVLSLAALPTWAQDSGALDGNWEGAMSMIHGTGLREKGYPPQVWRLAVQGNSVEMFIRGADGSFTEVKPGGFKLVRHLNNALIYSLDSASDGSWVETEAWSILKKNPDTLSVILSGAVNNPKSNDPNVVEFFTVRTGVFQLVK